MAALRIGGDAISFFSAASNLALSTVRFSFASFVPTIDYILTSSDALQALADASATTGV